MGPEEPREPTERREIYYSGRVQGVGFRYTTRSIAKRFAVTGYVRNLSDGRVELVIEGTAGEIRQILRTIQAELGSYIRDVREATLPASRQFADFDVRY